MYNLYCLRSLTNKTNNKGIYYLWWQESINDEVKRLSNMMSYLWRWTFLDSTREWLVYFSC